MKADAKAKEDAKAKADAQAKQDAALNDMLSGLEAENEQRDGAKDQHMKDEKNRYGAIYKQMIQQKLLVDQSFKGQECKLRLRLAANGLVLNVSQLAGNDTLCRAAKSAVLQVDVFPMPDDPNVVKQLREINLTVSP